jgi:hypothetical protein
MLQIARQFGLLQIGVQLVRYGDASQ